MTTAFISSPSLPPPLTTSSSTPRPKPKLIIQNTQTIPDSDSSPSARKLKGSSRLNRWSRARTVRSGRRLDRRPVPQIPTNDVNYPFQDGESNSNRNSAGFSDSEDDGERTAAKEIYMVSDGTGWTVEHSVTAALGQFEHCLVDRGCSVNTHLFSGECHVIEVHTTLHVISYLWLTISPILSQKISTYPKFYPLRSSIQTKSLRKLTLAKDYIREDKTPLPMFFQSSSSSNHQKYMSPADFETVSAPLSQEGWGPILGTPKRLFSDYPINLPYTPFNKSEKLGRIADFTRNHSNNVHEEEDSFQEILSKPKPHHQTKFNRYRKQPQLPQRKDADVQPKKQEFKDNRPRHYQPPPRREMKSSVDIQPEWTVMDQIPFSSFNKLSCTIPDAEDLFTCGAIEFYDKSYDRITPASEKRLEKFKNRSFFKVTTSDDPVIRRLANEDKATVFATDEILSTLMCANRSVYSWDIVVQRVGNKLFFDKRDGSGLDLVSVNETSQEVLPEAKEDINSAISLSVEAAYINQNFSQQVLVKDGGKVKFEEQNPFASEGEEVASAAYRYRRWKLAEDVHVVARCEVQGVTEVQGKQAFMTLKALNEFDPKYNGIDWRKKLETQRGAVLATELKNNANKLARWTAQALLANVDVMKLGFVSRVHPRDHFNHGVLAVVGYKPKEFATQINLNTSNMWGIVKSIVDLCMKLKEGKYVLVKDPSKPQVRIYEVPAENEYVEEPLPEDEQVKPPTEEGVVVADGA